MEYIFKSLYVRSELCVCDKLYELFYLSPFPPIRHSKTMKGEKVDFKTEYFQIWQSVWNLHKQYHGVSADDEQKWQELDKECEQIDQKYDRTTRTKVLAIAAFGGGCRVGKEREAWAIELEHSRNTGLTDLHNGAGT